MKKEIFRGKTPHAGESPPFTLSLGIHGISHPHHGSSKAVFPCECLLGRENQHACSGGFGTV